MNDTEHNTRVVRDFVRTVWADGDIAALGRCWTEDSVNHVTPGPHHRGLGAVRDDHEQFMAAFAVFSDTRVEIVRQVAEGDTVVTQITTLGEHADCGCRWAASALTGRALGGIIPQW